MPKQNKPPKYCKMGKYALVYHQGRKIYLGLYGSPESKAAYTRLLAEIQANPIGVPLSNGEKRVTISELAAAFLENAKTSVNATDYDHYRTALFFLLKLYGDNFPADDFKPRCLKLVREEMVKSRRFCRNTVNKYARFIVTIFAFGVENELVLETTWRALKVVKSLPKGHEGTFDHEERESVPDEDDEQTASRRRSAERRIEGKDPGMPGGRTNARLSTSVVTDENVPRAVVQGRYHNSPLTINP
jgi:hypothetical protein